MLRRKFLIGAAGALAAPYVAKAMTRNPSLLNGGYQPPAIQFDGMSWLNRGNNIGQVDGQKGLAAFWFWAKGGASNTIISPSWQTTTADTRFAISLNASGRLQVFGRDAADATNLLMTSNASFNGQTQTGWKHFAAWWDLSATKAEIYINGVRDTINTTTTAASTIDYLTDTSEVYIGAQIGAGVTPTAFFTGYLAQVYLDLRNTLDLSVPSNLVRLISPEKTPVNMGPTGAFVTGTVPQLFLNNPEEIWNRNLGSGGSFKINNRMFPAQFKPRAYP